MRSALLGGDPSIYLNEVALGPQGECLDPAAVVGVHRVVVVDCSGSMTTDLARLRSSLKARLPTLVREHDTLSVLWFSGRGQFGVLLEGEGLASLRDLARIGASIDRWLQPLGLTGFKEPLVEVGELIGRISGRDARPFSLFFMSDGMDNQWPREEVLAAVARLAPRLASATVVEYGYYADRPMLARMAEVAGGQLICADSFDRYEPALARELARPVGPLLERVELDVGEGDVGPVQGIVFEVPGEGVVAHAASSGKVAVPVGARRLWWLSRSPAGLGGSSTIAAQDLAIPLYAALSLYAVRARPDVVLPILRFLGDVRFIRMFANCFGKQAYSALSEAALAAAHDPALRLLDGFDPHLVPPEDAFTVLDVLQTLSEDESAKIVLEDPAFAYSRITRKMVSADDNLAAAEGARIAELSEQMRTERSATRLRELQSEIDDVLASKRRALEFLAETDAGGVAISSLTMNEASPNVSVLIRRRGSVDLSSRRGEMPAALVDHVDGHHFPTFVYRNYAVIAHGILNVSVLPVTLSDRARRALMGAGVRLEDAPGGVTLVHLSGLPIINRRMVRTVTLRESAEIAYQLVGLRAAQKVYKEYADPFDHDDKIVAFSAKYGDEAARWLRDEGITEGGGFNPRRVQGQVSDFIVGRELKFKVKGYSSLPPVDQVRQEALAGRKLRGPAALMGAALLEVEAFMRANPKKLHKDWIVGKKKSNGAEARAASHRLSQIAFSVIVGQVWFADAASPEEDTAKISVDGAEVTVTAELREVQVDL